MKHKFLACAAGIAALGAALGAAGCPLALADTGSADSTLVGVYAQAHGGQLTALPDAELTPESALPAGTQASASRFLFGGADEARLYADAGTANRLPMSTAWRTLFPGVTGYALCRSNPVHGDAVSGAYSDPNFTDLHFGSEDAVDTMEGTLYADINEITGDVFTFALRPIFQAEDGRLYLGEANQVSCDTAGLEGSGLSLSFSSSESFTAGEHTESSGIRYTASVEFLYAAQTVRAVQLGADYAALEQAEYTPDTLPDQIDMVAQAEFVLLESRSVDADGQTHTWRDIVGRDDLLDYGDGGMMAYATLYLHSGEAIAEVCSIGVKG